MLNDFARLKAERIRERFADLQRRGIASKVFYQQGSNVIFVDVIFDSIRSDAAAEQLRDTNTCTALVPTYAGFDPCINDVLGINIKSGSTTTTIGGFGKDFGLSFGTITERTTGGIAKEWRVDAVAREVIGDDDSVVMFILTLVTS